MRILSFDPGKLVEIKRKKSNQLVSHFAYALLVDGTVTQYGSIKPIQTLKHPEYTEDAHAFVLRVKALVDCCDLDPNTDIVVIERFMDRGGGRSTTGEFINQMIALVAAAIYPIKLQQEPAALWKNWLARAYKIGKSTTIRKCWTPNMWLFLRERFPEICWPPDAEQKMTIHEGDACGIALWKYETSDPQKFIGTIDQLIGPQTRKIAA